VIAAPEVTLQLPRPAAVALLELATKRAEELPPDLRLVIRTRLLGAVHLAPSAPVK
jgi:hypothetical protein